MAPRFGNGHHDLQQVSQLLHGLVRLILGQLLVQLDVQCGKVFLVGKRAGDGAFAGGLNDLRDQVAHQLFMADDVHWLPPLV